MEAFHAALVAVYSQAVGAGAGWKSCVAAEERKKTQVYNAPLWRPFSRRDEHNGQQDPLL